MPQFQITDNESGDTLTIDADRAPTQTDADEIFASRKAPKAASVPVMGKGREADAASMLNLKDLSADTPLAITNPNTPRDSTMDSPQLRQTGPGALAQLGREVGQGAKDAWGTVSTPLAEIIPKVSRETADKILSTPAAIARDWMDRGNDGEEPSPILSAIAQSTPSDKAIAIGTGIEHGVSDLGNFFTSPLGIATLGIGSLPAVAQRAVALGFAAQMASEVPGLATQLGAELGKPENERDYQKIAQLATSAVGTVGFTAAGVAHGAGRPIAEKMGAYPSDIAPRVPLVEKPVEAPVTPEAAPIEQPPIIKPEEAPVISPAPETAGPVPQGDGTTAAPSGPAVVPEPNAIAQVGETVPVVDTEYVGRESQGQSKVGKSAKVSYNDMLGKWQATLGPLDRFGATKEEALSELAKAVDNPSFTKSQPKVITEEDPRIHEINTELAELNPRIKKLVAENRAEWEKAQDEGREHKIENFSKYAELGQLTDRVSELQAEVSRLVEKKRADEKNRPDVSGETKPVSNPKLLTEPLKQISPTNTGSDAPTQGQSVQPELVKPVETIRHGEQFAKQLKEWDSAWKNLLSVKRKILSQVAGEPPEMKVPSGSMGGVHSSMMALGAAREVHENNHWVEAERKAYASHKDALDTITRFINRMRGVEGESEGGPKQLGEATGLALRQPSRKINRQSADYVGFVSGEEAANFFESLAPDYAKRKALIKEINDFAEAQNSSTQKYRIGNNPQTYTLVERLPQSDVEKSSGEQPVRVRNDKTGKEETILEQDLQAVKERTAEEKAAAKEGKRDLDAELKTAKMDPSVFPDDASKREALKRAKEKGELQGAISTSGPPLAPAPSPAPSLPPKSQRLIIADLAKGLKLPIRFGRLITNKYGGYFQPLTNLIGSKKANDIPVVTHEVGHKLDQTFGFSRNPAIRSELDILGDPSITGSRSSWTPSKSIAYKLGEGMAEFTRLYLTDPVSAQRAAPNTWTEFNRALDANKDVGDTIRQAQQDIQVWKNSQPQARLRSHISVGENPNKTRYTLPQLTRDLVDDLHILRMATDDAKKLTGRDLPPSKNPYLLARLLRGSYGMADTFIRHGTADFNTKAVTLGKSLEDALKPIGGRLNDFRDWIVAKRAQELHAQGRQTGLVDSDVQAVAAKFDADPAFQDAFNRIKEWQESILKYAVDSNLISPDSANAMRRMNQDYVPFHRVFEVGAGEMPSLENSGVGRGLNLGTPGSLRKLSGSPRDIVDPIETMIKNAYTLITASEKSAINNSIADLAYTKGMGKWVEKVANPKENVKVSLEKLREQLEANGADLTNVPDDLLLTFYRNSGRAPFGENIIKANRGGKPEFYRLNKDLFDTFHALDLDDAGTLLRIFSQPANILRVGVTLEPDFAFRNVMKDAFSSAVISKYGVFPFEAAIKGTAAMIKNPKLVSEWAASGGENSIEANYFDRAKLQRFLRDKITKELTPAEQALVVAKSPIAALRWLTGTLEQVTRVGEYKIAFDKLTESGMPEGDARRMAAFEARDRQDFAKGGAKTKILRHATAFWNASLQANIKLVQAFKERPIKTTLAGLAFITLPKLLEQAVNWDDKDYWDRPQWERDLFFMIPIGKDANGHTEFMRIPTAFELGVIFSTLPGRALQSMHDKDMKQLKDYPKFALTQATPNPIPQFLMLAFEDFLTGKQGYDTFRERPIVPDSLKNLPPEMQYTAQTSLTAKKIGQLTGQSPMKIDHLMQGLTGGLGKKIIYEGVDRAVSAATGEPRTATRTAPGASFVTVPAAASSQSIEDFYSTLDTLRTESERKKHGEPAKVSLGMLPEFEKASRDMGEARKKARQTKDETARQSYEERALRIARKTMERYRVKQALTPTTATNRPSAQAP